VFRWLRWQLAKMRLSMRLLATMPPQVHLVNQVHRSTVEELPPNTEPYQFLAAHWNDYAGWLVPRYGRFLAAAASYYDLPLGSVLDLACGTGLLSRQIAKRAQSVVGLDVSEPMLRRAGSCTSEGNVRYVQGDFRAFDLGETFDAAVCGSDSLNYLETPGELTDVFRCVRRHLRPGGLFAFDVLDDQWLRVSAHTKSAAEVSGESFEVYYFYDPGKRVRESRAVLGRAIERHRQIPIEEGDVTRAAREAGLSVAEHFSANTYLLLKLPRARQFYVLRTPSTSPPP
jgi:SAM-dependent methyltransferase